VSIFYWPLLVINPSHRPNRKVSLSVAKMMTAPCRNKRTIVLFLEMFDRHLYHLAHASAYSDGGNSVLPLSERNPLLLFRSSTLFIECCYDWCTLCSRVCEVSAVTHYQRQRMVESIDRFRLYHQFPNFNDGDCSFV
jgi:hypothetical protein